MTMILYGTDTCTACKQATMLLGQSPLDWAYQDVRTIPQYTGVIPMLMLENGTMVIGLGPINQFIKQWKQEHGFQ